MDARTHCLGSAIASRIASLKSSVQLLKRIVNGRALQIETCNSMLSLFLKLNKTGSACALYAEAFLLRSNSTIYTHNIMINLLREEGKLKKANAFILCMESLRHYANRCNMQH
ncbi:hypothetical protein SAY86_004477 [Trapa natans]|uniref:Pentatricopeptide repeat-containing protein n=1 Tax=Trapa natans TaxID=22666 RepID=A0AAN7MEI5_TRANT|nr:hypothetical protein SAY86_004477 [Trapa natans]